MMKKITLTVLSLLLCLFAGCSTFSISPVDFSWPVERVLQIDSTGIVTEDRYSFSFFTLPLFQEERGTEMIGGDEVIRVIRDAKGYYFFTVELFKHVYVFELREGELMLVNKILISENGILNPAFNQRQPYIELLFDDQKINLTFEGIVENQGE